MIDFNDTRLQTAILSAVITLMLFLAKDLFLQEYRERRDRHRAALIVYRRYAEPLGAAAESLFWRFNEILVQEGRGAFLRDTGDLDRFDAYKRASTLYRFAALIGWLRAWRREMALFPRIDEARVKEIEDAVRRFETALADGAHVETRRLQGLAELFSLPVPKQKAELSALAVKVEKCVRDAVRGDGVADPVALAHERRLEVTRTAVGMIAAQAGRAAPGEDVIGECVARAVRVLSTREAWLYRDYQAGVGDLMIEEAGRGDRAFDVIGFAAFETMLDTDEASALRWIRRLSAPFDALDVSGADPYDTRVQMLEHSFSALMELLLALVAVDPSNPPVSEAALARARSLLDDRYWRKTVD